jgi:hypothetical protein
MSISNGKKTAKTGEIVANDVTTRRDKIMNTKGKIQHKK